MAQFEVRYGLGGGFGGYGDWEPCFSCKNIEEALEFARECAVQEYESYGGMHGLITEEEIAEENPDWDDEAIMDAVREDMESWIMYDAREVE